MKSLKYIIEALLVTNCEKIETKKDDESINFT